MLLIMNSIAFHTPCITGPSPDAVLITFDNVTRGQNVPDGYLGFSFGAFYPINCAPGAYPCTSEPLGAWWSDTAFDTFIRHEQGLVFDLISFRLSSL